jgi:predicted nucleic acid-binding protein
MILYLDTSALVKRYVAEAGSAEVNAWMETAEVLMTSLLTRAEMAAALNRLHRMNVMDLIETHRILGVFHEEWESLLRLPVTEMTVQRAGRLTSLHDLRGYDAVHLATVLIWQETSTHLTHFAACDHLLWQAARSEGLAVLPEK